MQPGEAQMPYCPEQVREARIREHGNHTFLSTHTDNNELDDCCLTWEEGYATALEHLKQSNSVPEQLYRKLLCEGCWGGRRRDPLRCMVCQGHKYTYEAVDATVQ